MTDIVYSLILGLSPSEVNSAPRMVCGNSMKTYELFVAKDRKDFRSEE